MAKHEGINGAASFVLGAAWPQARARQQRGRRRRVLHACRAKRHQLTAPAASVLPPLYAAYAARGVYGKTRRVA